ncbi:MAG: transketolase [Gammaproteobacteria bacterium]
MKKFNLEESKKRCINYRKRILEMSQKVTALHVAPAFSCLEILDLIYHNLLDEQDTFILSKGHGCLSQYVLLNDLGVLSEKDLDEYCTKNGRLGAHPDYGVPGIGAATGSLGHGLGIACGIAQAKKIKNNNSRVYVVVSDGELQEGSTWEALMMSANLMLNNITVFLDLNNSISSSKMSETHPAFYPIEEKLQAFGWETKMVDGHNQLEIYTQINKMDKIKPSIMICKTIKGKGVSYMENIPIWHYRSPNKEEYLEAISELDYMESFL